MINLMEQPMLALQVRRAAADLGDVIYVHGSTFGADLSIFFQHGRLQRVGLRLRRLWRVGAIPAA
ncbi:MAG: hypothetical protein V4641_13690 [Pseudomonadota bacterium]